MTLRRLPDVVVSGQLGRSCFRTSTVEAQWEDDAMNIGQILKAKGRAVATARPDATLLEIVNKLAQKKIGAIVIVGDNGGVVGIISERDVIRKLGERGPEVLSEPVSHSMTANVITCQETGTLDELMEVMTQGRFRHCPVIEDGALVGIISIGDVVKNHIAEVEMEVTAMRGYFVTG
jgi:CBS domain-containing protein